MENERQHTRQGQKTHRILLLAGILCAAVLAVLICIFLFPGFSAERKREQAAPYEQNQGKGQSRKQEQEEKQEQAASEGKTVEPETLDLSVSYREGEETVLDTESLSAVVTGYEPDRRDEEGESHFIIHLRLKNKLTETITVANDACSVNRFGISPGLMAFRMPDSRYEILPGGTADAQLDFRVSVLRAAGISSVDVVQGDFYVYKGETSSAEYPGYTVCPTGKPETEIVSGSLEAGDDAVVLYENDEVAFGIVRRTENTEALLTKIPGSSSGFVCFGINKTDDQAAFLWDRAAVNGIGYYEYRNPGSGADDSSAGLEKEYLHGDGGSYWRTLLKCFPGMESIGIIALDEGFLEENRIGSTGDITEFDFGLLYGKPGWADTDTGWIPYRPNETGDVSEQGDPSSVSAFRTNYAPMALTDSWEEIIAAGKDGTYARRYRIGDTKTLDLGEEGLVNMMLIAMDADELADNSGRAPMTWVSVELLNTPHDMNPWDSNLGGWETSGMRAYLRKEILPLLPEALQTGTRKVRKYSYNHELGKTAATTDILWIPSCRELFGSSRTDTPVSEFAETEGPFYEASFSMDAHRIKQRIGTSKATWWWTRSALDNRSGLTDYFKIVNSTGSWFEYKPASSEGGVALGFCL